MCTLTFAWQRFDDYLAVAATRDEAYARPASAPAIQAGEPQVFAPRDEEAGGTWIGYNADGVFAAITNRWTRDITAGDRSRGLLVRDALDRSDVDSAVAFLREELAARTYEPFQLVVADQDRAVVVEHDRACSITDLAPGVYVVGNTGWCGERVGPTDAVEPQRVASFFVPGDRPERGREQAANDRQIRDALLDAATDMSATDWLDAAGVMLGDHEFGVCVHGDGFGTKSASLVRLGEDRAWAYADGHPCETAFDWLKVL